MSKIIQIGKIQIGGGQPVAIQSMCNTDTRDAQSTIRQILELEELGCDIIRVAVPDMDAAEALREIKKSIHIPLVADIHFDYRLALASIQNGVDKIRLNPGNIKEKEYIKQVVEACKTHHIPIRIGVNSGSVPKDILQTYQKPCKEALLLAAKRHIDLLQSLDFDDIVVSLKSSDTKLTVETYRYFKEIYDYPLHLGITEAGTLYQGIVKSSVGIGSLLLDGIGDTLRVSLTAAPKEEIKAAKAILKAAGHLVNEPTIISCPTCGRTKIDLIPIASKVEKALAKIHKPIKVAVMGCVVNGPGEAREADIGIAGGDGCAVLFKKGEIIRTIQEEDIVKELLLEMEKLS